MAPGVGEAGFCKVVWVGIIEGVEATLPIGLQAVKTSTRIRIGNPMCLMVYSLSVYPFSPAPGLRRLYRLPTKGSKRDYSTLLLKIILVEH
jgi:hypothetical protein